jgi:hypothetical protein
MAESDVALELFLAWLNREHGRSFRTESREDGAALATDGAVRLAVEVAPLLGPTENEPWLAARRNLEERVAEEVPASLAVWVPAGAELPAGEPQASEFLSHLRSAAVKLGPHERSHIPLPIKLLLRKNTDSGGVVSVTGGLNPHWARFTDRVRGTYDLDSTQLHRLPESEEHLESLIDTIVERSSQLEPGRWTEIETIDAWTIQRLHGDGGAVIVAVPPADAQDAGLAVRRNFRRILADKGPRLREREAELRALVVLGYYARMDQEGATTAMRGYDPGLYTGIDFVCLVADGQVKALMQAPAAVLPWNRS